MKQKNQLIAQCLTYAGIAPFFIGSGFVVLGFGGYDYGLALSIYGAVIIAFLCGIHWAAALFFPDKCRVSFLVYSNVIALAGWVAALLPAHRIGFVVEILCFATLLVLDRELRARDILPQWFFRLRCRATLAVLVLLSSAVFYS